MTIDWDALTRTPAKAEFYGREAYFREGLATAREFFPDDARFEEFLRNAAFLLVKPDGLAAGKLKLSLSFLEDHDFSVVGAQWITFDRLLWREFWRYQQTCASLDRLAVNDWVLNGRRALLIAVHDRTEADLPATLRLSALKGSAAAVGTVPGSLRKLLGQSNKMFNFVHVPDEPADVLRETGLLLDEPARREVLHAWAGGALSSGHRAILDEALREDAERSDQLHAADAVERVTDAVLRIRELVPEQASGADRVLSRLARMREGGTVPWREFMRDVRELGSESLDPKLDHWDLAVLGACFTVYDEPGAVKLIEGPDRDAWRR
jgi:hypothetical protein